MTILPHTPSDDRLRNITLAVLPLVAIGFTGLLSRSPDNFFQPYFGSLHPLLAVAMISLIGGGFSKRPFSWADAYAGLHVFAFNLLQLYVFRRYDFLSMYIFRLVYYIEWHIAWGAVRLHVLS